MLITDAAVRETAATLTQKLGGDWALDPEAPADGAAHLIHSDGRAISFRPIFGGATVQLWITGNAAPSLPDDATPAERATHEAQIAARLAQGHRYNKATTLVTEEEEDPAVIILRTLEDDLLPAFEYKPRYVGHRPWIDLFHNALAAVTAEHDAPSAPADTDEDTEPEDTKGVDADREIEREPTPEDEEGAQPQPRPTRNPDPKGKTPNREADAPPEPAPEPTSADETSPTANGRPRKPTPKRRRRPAPPDPV
ncbi:hypothetical protein FBY35_5879 [Streptomyces sp. SLBN-118]|uniref:hypothetical protein n=1 Tax=Streptomyces sp. SLBN-118 TaxID=2768454 RepID=UPI0011500294|nr:hypothetical protein [Streptomyces sp. SLBN-118]TQK44375.1 hypothetical protein FBY35_5879 [Streptomyces sp. SLBN-118]